MNKDTILEMLSSDSECLSLQEVYNILNEELEKSPEEMDTDLIELCIDAIDSANSEKVNNKRVKLRVSKVLFAAALFVILIAISIPVCAKFFNVNVPNGIVEFYGDCFNINISNDKYIDDILVELEKNGVENAVLPDFLFKKDIRIFNFNNLTVTEANSVEFSFERGKLEGRVSIQEYLDEYSISDLQNKLEENTDGIDAFSINNIIVLLYSNDDIYYIEYVIDNCHYMIGLMNCDYETACEIANSI